jgi:hypothetical protein
MAVLNAHLSAEELESLREVSKGPTQRTIPPQHRAHLIDLALIYQGTTGLGVTLWGSPAWTKENNDHNMMFF